MSHQETEDYGSRLAWFLTGAAIGAAFAILYAPKAGKDTRQLITRTARDSREAVTDTTRDVIERGRDIYVRSRQVVDDAADLFERGPKLVRG